MLNMRFDGTDTAIMVLPEENEKDEDGGEDFMGAFRRAYKAEFGFLLEEKNVIVDDVKVRASGTGTSDELLTVMKVRGIGKTFDSLGLSVFKEVKTLEQKPVDRSRAAATHSTYFDNIGRVNDTPVFLLDDLKIGDVIEGPSMVIDNTQTILIVPKAKATVTRKHLFITLE